jgi:hypothetical protein
MVWQMSHGCCLVWCLPAQNLQVVGLGHLCCRWPKPLQFEHWVVGRTDLSSSVRTLVPPRFSLSLLALLACSSVLNAMTREPAFWPLLLFSLEVSQ